MPALLRENYEFALFALLFLYTFFSGDMFVSLLIGSGGLIWLALSRFLKSEKKNPTEK